MATGNFSKVNAKNYYVIYDTYKDENGEDVQREFWDFEDLREFIRENGRETKLFPEKSDEYVDRDAKELCYGSYYTHFGKNGFLTDTTIVRTIIMRSGYYEGSNLDWDIEITSPNGFNFKLSEYDSLENLVEDYMDSIRDYVDRWGADYRWNLGTFKIQRKNIEKWLTKIIEKEEEICEKFCKDNCEDVYVVSARFSNGETWYSKVS